MPKNLLKYYHKVFVLCYCPPLTMMHCMMVPRRKGKSKRRFAFERQLTPWLPRLEQLVGLPQHWWHHYWQRKRNRFCSRRTQLSLSVYHALRNFFSRLHLPSALFGHLNKMWRNLPLNIEFSCVMYINFLYVGDHSIVCACCFSLSGSGTWTQLFYILPAIIYEIRCL